MAVNKLKVMLSFMREINDGNIPTPEDYGISEKEYFDIIEACQTDGLIMKAIPCPTLSQSYTPYILDSTILTVKGLEYLDAHSAAMKAYKGLKELRDWLPF